MNVVAEVPQAMGWTSPHHAETHQLPRVHETGGLGEMLWGTQLVSALRRFLARVGMGWRSQSTASTRGASCTLWA
jgi:hypothetical protein